MDFATRMESRMMINRGSIAQISNLTDAAGPTPVEMSFQQIIESPVDYFKQVYGKPPFWSQYTVGERELQRARRR